MKLKILELAGRGVTQEAIAAEVGCHQSTVSRTLDEYDDTRPLARKLLESKALELTRRLVIDANPETILRVLAKLDVVRDEDTHPESIAVVLGVAISAPPARARSAPVEATVGTGWRV